MSTPARTGSGNVLSIIGIVLGVVALLIPLVGIAGIICAGVAIGRKEPMSRTAMIVAVVLTVIGFALNAYILSRQ